MTPFLRILENEVQIAALSFMVIVYILRLRWLFRFRISAERTWAAGSERAGIVYALLGAARPGAMASSRKRSWFFVQFVVFHVGVAVAIGATFVIPYAPRLFRNLVAVRLFQIVIGAAAAVGILRLIRRIRTASLRAVSTPDDYVSIVLMILFFGAGVLAVPNTPEKSEWPLALFFALTAVFLVYVPFSKICHYLYYPFTRYFLGKTLGHRGVFPPRKAGRVREGDA